MSIASVRPVRLTRRSAAGVLWLIAALPMTFAIVAPIALGLTPHEDTTATLILVVTFLTHLAAGALWGRAMGRIAGSSRLTAAAAAGAFGFAISTLLAVLALNEVEQLLTWFLVRNYAIHTVFQLSFTAATAWIAGSTALLLGLALGRWKVALRLAAATGLAAALTFYAVALILDTLGMRVGAPGAEERFTMVLTAIVGMWSGALLGSIVLGRLLAGRSAQPAMQPEVAAGTL